LTEEKAIRDIDTWTIADTLMSGYTTVIFMLRKAATAGNSSPEPICTDNDVPQSPLAFQAARHIVAVFDWLFRRFPDPGTVSFVFGGYRSYVGIGYLVKSILQAPDSSVYAEDIELLESVGGHVTYVSKLENEFTPLARAIQYLIGELRNKVEASNT
jgi:hypothetical protein